MKKVIVLLVLTVVVSTASSMQIQWSEGGAQLPVLGNSTSIIWRWSSGQSGEIGGYKSGSNPEYIAAANSTTNYKLINCATDNIPVGVTIDAGADNAVINNFTIVNCPVGLVNNATGVTVRNTIFNGCTTDNTGGFTSTTNMVTGTDPMFVSASDFRLLPSSPAINAGTDVGLTTDYRGMTVPQRGAVDIGAYEFGPGDAGWGGGARFNWGRWRW